MNQTFTYILLFLTINLLAQEDHLLKLLPTADELQAYEMKNEPEYYQGDDLFFLINGGAEIYLFPSGRPGDPFHLQWPHHRLAGRQTGKCMDRN